MEFSRTRMASNLRAFRAFKGVTRAEAAACMGISAGTLRLYEIGQATPTYENAWRIADYYNIPIDAIGGRNGEIIPV